MSKERLSRLQKFILEFLYNQENQVTQVTKLKYCARRSEGLFKTTSSRASMAVTFSRSLRSLYWKGLIEVGTTNPEKSISSHIGHRKAFDDEGNLKWFFLTEEGEAKIKEPLNVKNIELNNKTKEGPVEAKDEQSPDDEGRPRPGQSR